MLKRTKGRLLLTLLVITGLAGTINNTSLTKEERKYAVGLLKDTKTDFLQSVKGLSEAQLNYRSAPDKWTIKECAFHIALVENRIAELLETTMKSPAMPEKRTEIKMNDAELVKALEDRTSKFKAADPVQPDKATWKTLAEATTDFKDTRGKQLKYVKNTTENLRDHLTQMPFGWIDSYQIILFVAAHSNRHTQQINEIRANPGFPKK